MKPRNNRGFSMVEMLIVIAIVFIMAAFATLAFTPMTQQQHVTEAYNSTLTTLRRAHDQAQNDMVIYVATFTAPGTITVQQEAIGTITCQIPPNGPQLLTTVLPSDITFHVEPGVPTSNTTAPMTPDQFGTAAAAIDFDEPYNPGTNYVCFFPDGTAQDSSGNMNNGVVYLGLPGNLYTSRAITLWGTTGRLRGWQLYNVNGVNSWVQQ
jgi:prepilin-type N-terminal cleavage/methylation domain-containing protein